MPSFVVNLELSYLRSALIVLGIAAIAWLVLALIKLAHQRTGIRD